MKQNQFLLLIAAIIALASLCYVALVSSRSTWPANQYGSSPTPNQAQQRPDDLDETLAGVSTVPSKSRVQGNDSTPLPGPARDYILFSFDDGRPAATLRYYPIYQLNDAIVSSIAPCSAARISQFDELGRISLKQFRPLPPALVIELSAHAVQVILLSEDVSEYRLARVLERQVRIASGHGNDERFECVLWSSSFAAMAGWLQPKDDHSLNTLLDKYCIQPARTITHEPIVIARFAVGTAGASERLHIPDGIYHIESYRSPFGWSVPPTTLIASSPNLDVTALHAPPSHVYLGSLLSAKIQVTRAVIVEHTKGATSSSTGEVEVPFKITGDQAVVSLDWRPLDETDSTYALRLYCSDGRIFTSSFGSWTSLSSARELNQMSDR